MEQYKQEFIEFMVESDVLKFGEFTLKSGSGPTVFGIYEDRMQARRAMAAIRKSRLAKQLFLTTPYNNNRRNG